MLGEPGAVAGALVPVMPRNLTVVEGLWVSDQPVFMVSKAPIRIHMVVPDLVFKTVEGTKVPWRVRFPSASAKP